MTNPIGSRWLKCDLHVHTPADRWTDFTFSAHPTPAEQTAWAEKLIDECVAKNLELIAITEHNRGDYIDLVRQTTKRKGGSVCVLPGVEVASTEGIHIVILFDSEKEIAKLGHTRWAAYVEHILSAIKVPSPRFVDGKPQPAKHTAVQILELVDEEGGLCYFPHALSGSGGLKEVRKDCLLGYSTGQTKTAIYKHPLTRIVQIPTDLESLPKGYKPILMGEDKNYGNKAVACICCSDTRSFADLGGRHCWIKGNPSFNGLKQIIFEPKLRTHIGVSPPGYLYARIKTLRLRGFDKSAIYCLPTGETELALSPNLTAVIGGRGTGKTLVAELLAYVVDKHSKTDGSRGRKGLIDALGAELSTSPATTGILTGLGQGEAEFSRMLPDSTSPAMGFGIEYWSQGRIERSTDDEQIKQLVAPLLTSEGLEEAETTLETRIADCKIHSDAFAEVAQVKQAIADGRANLARHNAVLNTVKDQAHQLVVDDLTRLSALRQRQEAVLSRLEQYDETIENAISELETDDEGETTDVSADIAADLRAAGISDTAIEAIEAPKKLAELLGEIRAVKKSYQESQLLKDTASSLQAAQKQYAAILAEIGLPQLTEADVAAASTAVSRLEQQLKLFGTKLKAIAQHKKDHESKAPLIQQGWEEVSRLRNECFTATANSLGTGITIVDSMEYELDEIATALAGGAEKKNLRIDGLVQALFSAEGSLAVKVLVESLEKKKIPNALASTMKDTARHFFEDLADDRRTQLIMRLKEIVPHPKPKITQNGKDISELSFGERCALALRLILASGSYPLIIDQPEDQLDNEFIWDTLLGLLRDKKLTRQIIVITHNPNVVVNADAELVIVLRRDGKDSKRSTISAGGIEDPTIKDLITKVLEGGELAFLKRERRYELSRSAS